MQALGAYNHTYFEHWQPIFDWALPMIMYNYMLSQAFGETDTKIVLVTATNIENSLLSRFFMVTDSRVV